MDNSNIENSSEETEVKTKTKSHVSKLKQTVYEMIAHILRKNKKCMIYEKLGKTLQNLIKH